MTEYEVEEVEQTTEKKKSKKKSEDTPNYDAKSVEARKYIVGGAAIFVPDLCEALRQDWYPNVPHDEIFKTSELRNEIKHRVLEEWCSDRTADGVGWARPTIWRLWPDWLAEPRTGEKKEEAQIYQAYRNFMTQTRKNKQEVSNATSSFPEVPVEPEEPEPTPVEHKEKMLTPKQIYDLSMYHIGELWRVLGKYNSQPGPKTNIETAILAPSEKYRLRLLKGLEQGDRAALVHQISHLNTFCVGFLKHVRTVLSEEKGIDK
jgi:hypothetical protein